MGNFTPNQEQIKSILQMLLGSSGPFAALIMSYGVPASQFQLWANLITAIVPPLIAAGWAIWDNTHKKTIAAAAAVPGVTEIRVADNATDGAKAAEQDSTLPNVLPMSAPSK